MLIISIAMMVLCVAMLAGTTLAWFVENRESGTNTIYSGNLNVKLWYKTDIDEASPNDGWMVLDENSKLFEGTWVPGTVKPLYLKIENCGDIAFNLRLVLEKESERWSRNLAGERFALSSYIKCETIFGYDIGTLLTGDNDNSNKNSLSGFLGNSADDLIPGDEKPVLRKNDVYYGKIVLTMPSNIDENATNYPSDEDVPTLSLGLTAVATQIESVNDDFSTVGVGGND
ncbi:MAG: hypothetical protein J6V93_03320 [Clostridia bacterium]|nr:hypothetical protein [Clostridia bacterium]